MKLLVKTALVLFFILGTELDSVVGLSPDKTETVVIQTAIYCDHCLECESCGGKIQRDLSFDKGIHKVVLDDKKMTVSVEFNPLKTNAEEIRKRISMYGYDADTMKADSLAVTKLDNCCLKK